MNYKLPAAGILALLLFQSLEVSAQSVPLFDGKTLDGWRGDAAMWRVEDGAITAGSLDADTQRFDYLATDRSFENFDLTFKFKLAGPKYVNTGIFFHNRSTTSREVTGIQADIGAGYFGGFYAHQRGVFAKPTAEAMNAAVKRDDWNVYRLRVEGRRYQTWINGVGMTDYTEPPNLRIEPRGTLALELSPNMRGIIRFKDFALTELPPSPEQQQDATAAQRPFDRIGAKMTPKPKLAPFADGKFTLLPTNEVAVFTGPENIVIEQRSGWIETMLTADFKTAAPRFRHMGWEGDTVYRQSRMQNHGTWLENFDAAGATTIFTMFGQMEALDETKTPADFEAAYARLLEDFAQRTPRIVVISPTPFEKPSSVHIRDNTPRNEIVKRHADIARALAKKHGFAFVDLYTPLAERSADAPKLTRDGIHFMPEAMFEVAGVVAKQLGIAGPTMGDDALRKAIVEKNRIWFDTWRAMNWAFAYGDRTTQPFARGANGAPDFADGLTEYRPLIARADASIREVAAGRDALDLRPPESQRGDPPAPSPEEQKSRFTVRDGFAVDIFADEKLGVVKPLQIRFDERGRLWALCSPTYPQLQPGESAFDYILVLEDTNGDGKADTSSKFAEGLMMPMGLEFGADGIYVCESTQLIFLRDTDGDGKADERRVLLSGFGTGDSHQNINSIRWGADGHLWFTQGYHIWSYIETPYGLAELNRSGIWRYNPRTLRLDGFLNESGGGLNCWGVTFDDHGQPFHGSGADVAIWHDTPALIRTLNPLKLGPGLARSRGKSMEPEFLGSSHLPDEYRGVLMKSTYFTSQVELYRLRDDGSGFASDALGDLLASKSNEFRPVESRVGPDGAIYICDWFNPIIGHYQASYRDPRRDRSHGRIWRMTANGRPLVRSPSLEKMSVTELIAQLGSPERWVRDQAQHLLYRKPKGEVVAACDAEVKKLTGEESLERLYRLSGIFLAHEEVRPELAKRVLSSSDFRWRSWGTRVVGIWNEKLPNAFSLLERSIADEHPRVRMEAIVAASYLRDPRAIELATRALRMPTDFGINYALTQATHALAPVWQPALESETLDFGTNTAGLVYALKTVGGAHSSGQIKKLATGTSLAPGARMDLLVALCDSADPDNLRFAFEQGAASPQVLTALARAAQLRNARPSGDLAAALEKSLGHESVPVRAAALRLAGIWRLKPLAERIRSEALDDRTPMAARQEAISALAALDGRAAVPTLATLTSNATAILRDTALATLAPLDVSAAATRAAAMLGSITANSEAAPILQPLLAQKNGPAELAAALTNAKPSAAAATFALEWMAKAGRDDAALVTALKSAAGHATRDLAYSPAVVAQWVGAAKSRGDAKRGELLYRDPKAACVACHKVGNDGGVIGPDLTVIGRAQTAEQIIESVLWPKRQVKEGFLLTLVTTKDGQTFQGYKSGESATELALRDTATGTTRSIRKADLQTRNDAGTVMPEGITGWMSDEQLADLLRYLVELGK